MMLLLPSNSNRRVLHPGLVLESDDKRVVCQFEEPIAPVEGSDVIAFGLVKEKFFQQSVRVKSYLPSNGSPIIEFQRTGDPVSAEQRQTYRASVTIANIRAKVGNEPNCLIVDISGEGFGAIATAEYKLGSVVQVLFSVEDQTVNTAVRVQTARQRADGKYRYGFLVAEKNNPARKALNLISLMMQRRQLKRLSGAA
ncbi:MAG: PilZ domain-containing protein [Phycisphaerae bacterium]|nr:PilZ domain-containing protein [Phycisphaerae bacterium]